MALAVSKNTSRRFVNARDAVIRAGFRALNPAIPGLAARWAEALFFTPPRRLPSARERQCLAGARRFSVGSGQHTLAAWEWGQGPLVVLVHGWGGVAAQLGAFIAPLRARGFRVVAFDAPGHGRSRGRRSSLVDFASALRSVAGSTAVHAVVAHSLGASATAFALDRGLLAERVVFIGPPANPARWTTMFGQRFGIAPAVLRAMRERWERRLGVRWAELDVVAAAGRQSTPLLVVHDTADREVAWADGAAIAEAWPGAELATTTGLGHQRLLRDPDVVERIVGFVARSAHSTPQRPRCGSETLERYLFERASRCDGA